MSSLEDSDNDDSLGLIPEREEPGKTGAPCDKVPGPSPAKVVLDGLVIWSCTSHPGILGSISKREEPVRDGQTSPHKPRLVVSLSTCPPLSPFQRELLYDRYCSNKQQPPQRENLQQAWVGPRKSGKPYRIASGSWGYTPDPHPLMLKLENRQVTVTNGFRIDSASLR